MRVDSENAPASWDRIEILSFSAGKPKVSDFVHWSAPMAQMPRHALSDDLDQRLPSGSVIYLRLPKTNGALGINVNILEFNIVGTQALIHASGLIVPAAGLQIAKRSVATLHGFMASTEPETIAHAWSELIGQWADLIAADAASFKMS